MRLFALVLVVFCGCASSITLRASTNDFLKRKATTLSLEVPPAQVAATLDRLFYERGFASAGSSQPGENGAQVFIYKGPRRVPPELAYSVQLGSWFAARVHPVGTSTEITLMGKPMISGAELCSEHDELLKDIKYTCVDTKVPTNWPGVNLVSGRDETEVVSWVLTGVYEKLKR
jgi:hypothetical protein